MGDPTDVSCGSGPVPLNFSVRASNRIAARTERRDHRFGGLDSD
jgi:hypothetical protein